MEQDRNSKRKTIKRYLLIAFLALYAAFSLAVTWSGSWQKVFSFCGLTEGPQTDYPFTVRIFSVGSADCILLQNGQHAMLIDSATEDQGVRLAQIMQFSGVERFDYIVATHPHSDHIGGFPDILPRIPADRALISPLRTLENYRSYRAMNKMFGSFGLPVYEAEPGDKFRFGDRAEIQVLLAGVPSENENEASLVIRVVYGGVSMLFMGDAEAKAEETLLKSECALRSDFIKLGHHGSKTSTSAELLRAVRPKYAVISCGTAAPPAEETLLRLDEMGIRAYRTDLDGDLLFATDGTDCEIKYSGITE